MLNLGGYAQTVNQVTLAGGSIANGSLTFSTLTAQSGAISANLTGSGALTVSGPDQVTLSGANSYTGGTSVTGGTLQLSGAGTLGASTGALSVSGGALDLGGTTQTTGALTLTAGTIQNGTLDASAFNVQGGSISAVLSGSGALTMSGTGTVTLSGANTYTGVTTVSAGTLTTTGAIAGGVINSAYVNAQGVIDGAIQNNSAAYFTLTGALTANAAFTNAGTLAVGAYSFSGVTTLDNSGSVTIGNGGVLTVSSGIVNSGSIVIAHGGTLNDDLSNSGTVTNSGAYDANVSSNTGTITNAPGATWTGNVVSNSTGVITNNGVWEGNAVNTGGTLNNQSVWTGSVANNSGAFTNSGSVSGGLTNGGTATNSGAISGGVTNTGNFTNAANATVNGGLTNTGTVNAAGQINGNIVNSGNFYVTGTLTSSGGAFTSSGGVVEVQSGGVLNAAALNVTGGALNLDSGSTLDASTVDIATGATLNVASGAVGLANAAYVNTGALNIQNGSATNVFSVGAYVGATGSVLKVGVNLTTGTADELKVAGATGTTQIVLTNVSPLTAPVYNSAGIPIVVSATAMSANAFTLANGPIQKGLFQYDLAYNADPAFVLIGAPTADAYFLDTVKTAAQSIFADTTTIWTDHQANLRDMLADQVASPSVTKVVKGPLEPAQPAPMPGLWATATGDWGSRSETQTYSDLNKNYAFQSGYQQNTATVLGGLDGAAQHVFGARDTLLIGATGGYIHSIQNFKASTASATYEGGSFGVSATYLNNQFFVDALLKTDILKLHFSDANIAFGGSQTWSNIQNYGGVIDAGYRFEFARSALPGKSFIEPMATLAYVATRVGGLNMGGAQIAFGGEDLLRSRIGLRGGATLMETDAYRIDGSANLGYWSLLAGASNAMINSGGSAPLLTLTDRQVTNYGVVGLNVNYIPLKDNWSGFIKGDYQFASGFNAGSIKGGLNYNF